MNKLINCIDNTKGTWVIAETTMHELYNVLNDFLDGTRRDEENYISRNKVNHLIAWLPNINSIIIDEKDERVFMEIHFDGHKMKFEGSGLEDYFIEMIEDGDFKGRQETNED